MFIYINQTDPDGSLTWLVNQLWNAEKSGKACFLKLKECNFLRVINRYGFSHSFFVTKMLIHFLGSLHFVTYSSRR